MNPQPAALAGLDQAHALAHDVVTQLRQRCGVALSIGDSPLTVAHSMALALDESNYSRDTVISILAVALTELADAHLRTRP